jgi:hypothetical protein
VIINKSIMNKMTFFPKTNMTAIAFCKVIYYSLLLSSLNEFIKIYIC